MQSLFLKKYGGWFKKRIGEVVLLAKEQCEKEGLARNSIELEITLRCNASCPQCSRHCNMFNYGPSDMTEEQIERFIEQVKNSRRKLEHITIMGGEPFLHPNFESITTQLFSKLVKPGHVRRLEVATNGLLPLPQALKKLPLAVRVSPPGLKKHRAQLVAPVDTGQKTKYCSVPHRCGMALNYFGYFPCGAGGAIVRLFNLKRHIKYALPDKPDGFSKFRKEICPLCQASAIEPMSAREHGDEPSLSFRKAIEEYKKTPPIYRPF